MRTAPPCEFTISIETSPSAAVFSQYSPSRPMWPECIIVPRASPASWAFAASSLISRIACTWPKPQLAIGDDSRRAFVENRQFLAGDDLALLDRLHVIRNPHHAVRVVALQVGIDEAGRDEAGFVGRSAAGLQEFRGERFERGGLEGGHGEFRSQ